MNTSENTDTDINPKASLKGGAAAKGKPRAKKTQRDKPARGPKKGIGFTTAAIMSLLAASIGGAAGWMGPKIFDPANAAPAKAITQHAEQINGLASRAKTLESTGEQLSNAVTNLQSNVRDIPAMAQNIAEQKTAIAAINSNTIITDPASLLAPITGRIDAVETLLAPQGKPDDKAIGDAQASASALLERITALEGKLEALRAAPPQSREPVVLSYSTPQNANGETPAEGQSADAPVSAYDLAANFPKDAMLAAMTAQKASQKDPSWIRKLLGSHVQSDDDKSAQTRASIDASHGAALRGDIKAAIDIIETLNPTVRASAHQWMIEAKKQS